MRAVTEAPVAEGSCAYQRRHLRFAQKVSRFAWGCMSGMRTSHECWVCFRSHMLVGGSALWAGGLWGLEVRRRRFANDLCWDTGPCDDQDPYSFQLAHKECSKWRSRLQGGSFFEAVVRLGSALPQGRRRLRRWRLLPTATHNSWLKLRASDCDVGLKT